MLPEKKLGFLSFFVVDILRRIRLVKNPEDLIKQVYIRKATGEKSVFPLDQAEFRYIKLFRWIPTSK